MPPNGLHASNLRSNSHSNEFPRPSEFYRNSSLLPPISSSSVSNGIGHSAGHSGGQSVSHSAATKHVLSNNHLGHNGIGHSTSSGLSSTSLGQNHGGLSHNHVPSLLDSKVDYVDRTLGYLGLGDQSHRHRSITIAEFPVSLEKPHFSRTISSMAVMENDAPLQGFEENVFGNTHSPVQSFDEKVLGFNVAHENVDPFAYSKQQESPPPSTNANSWEEMVDFYC